jgi:hypothetical protein
LFLDGGLVVYKVRNGKGFKEEKDGEKLSRWSKRWGDE